MIERVRCIIDDFPELATGRNGHEPKPDDAKKEEKRAELFLKLDSRRFDAAKPQPPPVPLFTINGQTIATRCNIQGIQAQSKAGKTAFLGAMFSAWMSPGVEFFGIQCCDAPQGALIHFDSEQSRYDHWGVCDRAVRRSALPEPPLLLRSYWVTDFTLAERKTVLRIELERARADCGCIFGAFLDGLADWADTLNDEQEAITLVRDMQQLAIEFDTSIYCVLHENEGSENSKMRGHLGSQLARKAETALRLQKDEDGTTVIFAERARHCFITKNDGPRFKWDDEQKMHVATASKSETKSDSKSEGLRAMASECFVESAGIGLTWQQLMAEIIRLTKQSEKTAERRLGELVDEKIIYKTRDRYYLK